MDMQLTAKAVRHVIAFQNQCVSMEDENIMVVHSFQVLVHAMTAPAN
jgi:hypothetical protein